MDYKFSEERFNNITTPIAAILAVIIASGAWYENIRSNKLNASQAKITNLNERLNGFLNKIDHIKIINRLALDSNTLEDLVLYRNYFKDVIIPTFSKLQNMDYSITVNNSYYDYLKDNSFIIENIELYYNNSRILEILHDIENLNIEAKTLEKEYYDIYCNRLEMEINSHFVHFKDPYYFKLYPYKNDDNSLEFRQIKNFKLPLKINNILKQINS